MYNYECDVCKTPCFHGQKACSNCGKTFNWEFVTSGINKNNFVCDVCKTQCSFGQKSCSNCGKTFNWEQIRKNLEKLIEEAPKIKCPFCEKKFPKLTDEQYRDSAELNVLKWAVVPMWGLAGSLKNKPFIQCPYCGMKIMQG